MVLGLARALTLFSQLRAGRGGLRDSCVDSGHTFFWVRRARSLLPGFALDVVGPLCLCVDSRRRRFDRTVFWARRARSSLSRLRAGRGRAVCLCVESRRVVLLRVLPVCSPVVQFYTNYVGRPYGQSAGLASCAVVHLAPFVFGWVLLPPSVPREGLLYLCFALCSFGRTLCIRAPPSPGPHGYWCLVRCALKAADFRIIYTYTPSPWSILGHHDG